MKEILTEDLLYSLRLMKYDRSRTLMENNLLLEQGSWDSKSGDNKYWIVLYNKLKSFGLNPKYGHNGKQVTDPNIATIIYWGQWIIWKDLNKNGGFPIQLYSPTGSATFKWVGGKYKGEELSKSMVNSKISRNATFPLTDFLPLKEAKMADKLIRYGGCETSLIGGIDVYREEQKIKEFPHCKQNLTKNISKSDPLYNQKVNPIHLTGDYKSPYMDYGSDIDPLINRSKATFEDLIDVVKKGTITNLYDIIWSNDVNKKEIEKFKYKTDVSTEIPGVTKGTTEKKLESGYLIFKKASNVVKSLSKTAGWSIDPKYKNGIVAPTIDFVMSRLLYQLPASVAIDPSIIEVSWVEAMGELIKPRKTLENKIEQTKKDFDRYEKTVVFGRGVPGVGLVKNLDKNKSLILQYRQKKQEWDKTNPLKNFTNQNNFLNQNKNPWDFAISDYEKRLQLAINNDKVIFSSTDETFSDLNKVVDDLRTAIEFIKEHNKLLSSQSKDKFVKACKGKIYPEYTIGGKKQYPTKGESDKVNCQSTFASNLPLVGEVELEQICMTANMGGMFVISSEEKERFKVFGSVFSQIGGEKESDYLTCMCAKRKVYNNDEVKLPNVKIMAQCPYATEVDDGIDYIYVKQGTLSVSPRTYLYKTKDVRSVGSKISDWGKSCITASNSEGVAGKDFHCLLDVASIATVFIPGVGPIISMFIDIGNSIYYLYDAWNAETSLDKYSAYISAGFTLLGGLSTGYARSRTILQNAPNALKVQKYADDLLYRTGKLGDNATQIEVNAIKKELQGLYKLTNNELKYVDAYINSLEKLKDPSLERIAKQYVKDVKNIKGKVNLENFNKLMQNRNFKDIMLKNQGDIIKSIKDFNRTSMGKEALQQLGFFAGGEAILPGLITPPIMAMIKSGKWGTFIQQLGANEEDLQLIFDNFGVDINNENQQKSDISLLERAWKDPNAIIVNGKKSGWRPGEKVPTKYQTPIYKKRVKEDELDQYLRDNDPWRRYVDYEGTTKFGKDLESIEIQKKEDQKINVKSNKSEIQKQDKSEVKTSKQDETEDFGLTDKYDSEFDL